MSVCVVVVVVGMFLLLLFISKISIKHVAVLYKNKHGCHLQT